MNRFAERHFRPRKRTLGRVLFLRRTRMHPKDLIRQNLDFSDRLVKAYVEDLDDESLLLRPVEGMNHIAWQLGHLISSERRMVEAIKPGSCPALPEGFDAA